MDGLAIAAALVAYSNLLNLWPPFNGPAYVPFNVTFAAALYLIAVGPLELGTEDLGLTHGGALEIALAVAAGCVITAPLFVAFATGRGRSRVADDRVKDLWGGALVYQTLVRVPLGTALLEELAFRGVLLASWRDLGTTPAVLLSSAVFGLWHISPTINLVRANRPGASTAGTARTAGFAVGVTTVAGTALAGLRLWTGSLYVPFAIHATVNSLATLAAALAHRRKDAT
ncbi:MAG TPA: type II CAAX endopeptidase family protein [Actinomycetota bacterium]